MPWAPDQYHKFQRERFAPFDDCLALVEKRAGLRVVDLGCGTGELTRRLADALPDSDVLGVDTSPEMLARAAPVARRGLRFSPGKLEETTGHWDLVFSHAAIHWVEDHPRLIPRLFELVAPGGQLVVQLPSNHHHFSQIAIRETASEAPFSAALDHWNRRSPVLPVGDYAELLFRAGAPEPIVFEKVYPHVLESADAVLEWVRGSTLVPYLERLPEPLHAPFLDRYRAKLSARWPTGPVFFGFQRILFSARRA